MKITRVVSDLSLSVVFVSPKVLFAIHGYLGPLFTLLKTDNIKSPLKRKKMLITTPEWGGGFVWATMYNRKGAIFGWLRPLHIFEEARTTVHAAMQYVHL